MSDRVPRVLVVLADGCEELEAVTIIDLLRRADVAVTVAGLEPGPVTASRGVRLLPDIALDSIGGEPFDLIVLPGGAEGARRLSESARIGELLMQQIRDGRCVAAICAAPTVLGRLGLLDHRRVAAYPGFLEPLEIPGVEIEAAASVVMDGRIITSRGPGTAMDFALFLIEHLTDPTTRDRVEAGLQRPATHHSSATEGIAIRVMR